MGMIDPTAWWRDGVEKRWDIFAHRRPRTAFALELVGQLVFGLGLSAARTALPKRWRW